MKNHQLQKKEILQGTIPAFALRTVAISVAFLLNFIIARWLDIDEVGLYFIALSITTIAAQLSRLGLDNCLLRFIASHSAMNEWGMVNAVYGLSLKITLVCSCVITIVIILFSSRLSLLIFNESKLIECLQWQAFSIPFLALACLHGFALQGLKKTKESIAVLGIYIPLFTSLCLFIYGEGSDLKALIVYYDFSVALTLILSVWHWMNAMPKTRYKKYPIHISMLLSNSIPLLFIDVTNLIIGNSSVFFLGIWDVGSNVSKYNAASRTATLLSFTLNVVNTISAPKFAELHKQKDMLALNRLAIQSAMLMSIMVLPITIVFLVVPENIMALFGEEYRQAGVVLSILSIGQLINVISGSVGCLLIMCGYERLMRKNLLICAVTNIFLNILLVPFAGIVGAAITATITIVMQNLIATSMTTKVLGITPLSFLYAKNAVKETN